MRSDSGVMEDALTVNVTVTPTKEGTVTSPGPSETHAVTFPGKYIRQV